MAHKAQGQTFDHIIIDLQSCRGSESPYVMLSRATSLQGVLILRPFQKAKITCHLSQDLRGELYQRLPLLTLQTQVRYGEQSEVVTARARLSQLLDRARSRKVQPTGNGKRKQCGDDN